MKAFLKRLTLGFFILAFIGTLTVTAVNCAGTKGGGGGDRYAGDPADPDKNYDPNDPNEKKGD